MSTNDSYGSQIRRKGRDIVIDLGDLREIVMEAVESKLESMKASAGNTLSSIKDNAASMARRTGERATAIVSRSPWKAMAGAAAAGALAAWYFRRK